MLGEPVLRSSPGNCRWIPESWQGCPLPLCPGPGRCLHLGCRTLGKVSTEARVGWVGDPTDNVDVLPSPVVSISLPRQFIEGGVGGVVEEMLDLEPSFQPRASPCIATSMFSSLLCIDCLCIPSPPFTFRGFPHRGAHSGVSHPASLIQPSHWVPETSSLNLARLCQQCL